ncbi:hypothetical protein TWF281_010895 [Arthrobotrys megalospora]
MQSPEDVKQVVDNITPPRGDSKLSGVLYGTTECGIAPRDLMSQNREYWNTILTAGPSTASAGSSSNQAPTSNEQQPPPMITRPEGEYIPLSHLRAIIGIPEKRLSVEAISKKYPDWPRNVAPDAAWDAVLVLAVLGLPVVIA